jgi:hypothetical protein
MLDVLEIIRNTGFGVVILGLIGSALAIVLIKLSAGSVNKVSPDYSHEVHVFRLLFIQSSQKKRSHRPDLSIDPLLCFYHRLVDSDLHLSDCFPNR